MNTIDKQCVSDLAQVLADVLYQMVQLDQELGGVFMEVVAQLPCSDKPEAEKTLKAMCAHLELMVAEETV